MGRHTAIASNMDGAFLEPGSKRFTQGALRDAPFWVSLHVGLLDGTHIIALQALATGSASTSAIVAWICLQLLTSTQLSSYLVASEQSQMHAHHVVERSYEERNEPES